MRRVLINIIVFLLTIQCQLQNKFIYVPSEKQVSPAIKKSLAIEPFLDLRKEENKNYYLYSLIPLVLWEKHVLHRKFIAELDGRISENLSSFFKKEINSYGSFSEIYLTNGQDSQDADFILRGKILRSDTRIIFTYFGLSLIGVILEKIGVPNFHFKFDAEFAIELVEVKTNKIIFSKNYEIHHKELISRFSNNKKAREEKLHSFIETASKDILENVIVLR